MTRMRRLLLVAGLLAAGLALATPAEAHPMGNFSINHFTSIAVSRHQVRLLYIVDMAEIPTFQELTALGVSEHAGMPAAVRARYLKDRARSLQRGLSLRFNGRPLPMRLRASDLIFPPGAGGLDTERLYLVLDAAVPASRGTLTYADHNFGGRAGWKEIVATAGSDARLQSSVPSISRSNELTVYPTGTVSAPPQDLQATVQIAPATGTAAPLLSPTATIRQAEAPLRGPHGTWSSLAQQLTRQGKPSFAANRSDPLSDLMKQHQLSIGVLLLSLIVAFWFGAGHALSPGHGKTIVGAYLVGSRGTAWHAVVLGLTVTATHTVGVFALGLITLYFSRFILPDQLYPWLGFSSGLVVALMGVTLFIRRWRALRTAKPKPASPFRAPAHPSPHRHAASPGSAPHVHRHGPFGRPHSHPQRVPEASLRPAEARGGDRVRARDLLALGISGGILPCPSALVVLLSAIAFHRIGFGLLLIVAFSFGLATTLTSVGMFMVYGGRVMARLGARAGSGGAVSRLVGAVRVLPVFSAAVVGALGSMIAVAALNPGALPAFLSQL
jgi:ABC-type nickel/cobalt efflux system permease component RcnA